MKTFAVFFTVLFAIMFFLGYKQGENFVTQPDFLERVAFSRVTIERTSDKCLFVYRANGKELYAFDVDKHKLYELSLTPFQLEVQIKRAPWRSFILNDPSIPTLLGGVGLGFSAKDILTNPKDFLKNILAEDKSEKHKQILGATLGSITGYGAGYWFATRDSIPEMDSNEIVNILKDEKKWESRKWSIYANVYSNLNDFVDKIDDSLIRLQYKSLLDGAALSVLQKKEKGADISSADLRTLSQLDEMFASKRQDAINHETLVDKILHIIRAICILLAVFGALFCLVFISSLGRK